MSDIVDIYSFINNYKVIDIDSLYESTELSLLPLNQSIALLQHKHTHEINETGSFYNPTIDISSVSTDTEYNKKWGKLDKQQKINRLMHYVIKMNLPRTEQKQLQNLLIDAILNKIITKKSDIEYCDVIGEVTSIIELKRNVHSGIFYLGKDVTAINITIHAKQINIVPFKKLDLFSHIKK